MKVTYLIWKKEFKIMNRHFKNEKFAALIANL
jgi:hypothetical protein